MFLHWGRFAYRHRKIVPVVIVAIIAALYLLAGVHLAQRMSQEGWDDPGSSSTHAAQIEQEVFGRDNNGDAILLFTAPEGKTVDDPAIFDAAQRSLAALAADNPADVEHVTSYFERKTPSLATADKTMAFASVGLAGDGEDVLKNFRHIDEQMRDLDAGGAQVQLAGSTAIADALDKGMAGDVQRAELVALPAVGIMLLVVFGSVVAAFMPLIVGVLSILGSLGVLALLAQVTQVNVFAQSVVTLLGLGLAIDYGLFMVSRFREELDQGAEVPDAVATATATAGKTVVFSAAMVAVALSGLLIFPQAFLKSVAYGAISAVGLAALLSITVLPSIFGLLGRNIDKLSLRRSVLTDDQVEQSLWARIPAWAMRHSKLVTVAVVAGLLALTIPLAGVKFGGINETYLPPQNQARVAQEEFDKNFPEFRTDPIKLVITNATNEDISAIYTQVADIGGLTGRFAPTQPTTDGTTVLSAGIADRQYNQAVVDRLRDIEVPGNARVYIGGTPALEVESIEALFDKLPWMAVYVIAATFILMALVFGSVVLPAKAVIMTMLGMGATLGIVTAMFVGGVGQDLFGFTAGPLMSPVLVLIMAIIYGLSTDYEVFLLSRMVEARERGADTDKAIRYGTAHTGNIITAAAAIMIVVCGAFGFSDIVMMKYIAFGMIAALFLDATIIRMLLVPAVMHLLREDNWWAPGWVKAASARMGHASDTPQPVDSAPRIMTEPIMRPAARLMAQPTAQPSAQLVAEPTVEPTAEPAVQPTVEPTVQPTAQPAAQPMTEPAAEPTTPPAAAPRPVEAKLPRPGGYDDLPPEPHPQEPTAEKVDTYRPVGNTPARSGRSVQEDPGLIPFSELMKRLDKEN